MTGFENFLIDKGYSAYTTTYQKSKGIHTYVKGRKEFSSMGSLANTYIHKDDKVLLGKIEQGLNFGEEEGQISFKDRDKTITYGLREMHHPPTLIYPRPRINIKRISNEDTYTIEGGKCIEALAGSVVYFNEERDSSMEVVMMNENYEDIYSAMFDKSIIFEYDLTSK